MATRFEKSTAPCAPVCILPSERKRVWVLPADNSAEIVADPQFPAICTVYGHSVCLPGYRGKGRGSANLLSLLMVTHGNLRYKTGSAERLALPGHILVDHSGSIVSQWVGHGEICHKRWVRIEGPGVDELVAHFGLNRITVIKAADIPAVSSLLKKTAALMEDFSTGHRLRLSVHAYHLLCVLFNTRNRTAKNPIIEAAVECMERHLHSKASLGMFSDAAGISRETLTRLFRAEFGVSPYTWFLRRKLHLARSLLGEEGLSVKQTSLALGWEDQGYFSRLFKKHMGICPVKVARSVATAGFVDVAEKGNDRV